MAPISDDPAPVALLEETGQLFAVAEGPAEPSTKAALRGLDLEELLDRVGGDPALLDEVLAIYLADTRESLLAMEAGVQGGNAPQVWRLAHRIRGASLNLALAEMAECAWRLETMGHKAQLEQAPASLCDLQDRFQDAQHELIELRAGLAQKTTVRSTA